jgi:hypothetical protein
MSENNSKKTVNVYKDDILKLSSWYRIKNLEQEKLWEEAVLEK